MLLGLTNPELSSTAQTIPWLYNNGGGVGIRVVLEAEGVKGRAELYQTLGLLGRYNHFIIY